MATKCTIREIYDIATAFITDRNTSVEATCDNQVIAFRFIKRGLAEYPYTLVVSAERGAPKKITNTIYMDKKPGKVYLHRGTMLTGATDTRTIISAETKHNVGRALDKTQSQIVQFGTRILSPRFFELLQMAENRLNNKIKTTNNTTQMFNLLYRIQNENQK